MRPSRALTALVLLLVALGGCAFLGDQVHIASSSSCISKNCRGEPDAPGYQRCEAACRSTYGR
ncbi:MAG TPA: hypothetical protein VIF09_11215 [Polyangiaceae bacterium]|jgi:hypothetical protein